MLTSITVFNAPYLSKLQLIEQALVRAAEQENLYTMQIRTLEDALPKLKDDLVWEQTYMEIERLHRNRIKAKNAKEAAWIEVCTILAENQQRPECEVIQIHSVSKIA